MPRTPPLSSPLSPLAIKLIAGLISLLLTVTAALVGVVLWVGLDTRSRVIRAEETLAALKIDVAVSKTKLESIERQLTALQEASDRLNAKQQVFRPAPYVLLPPPAAPEPATPPQSEPTPSRPPPRTSPPVNSKHPPPNPPHPHRPHHRNQRGRCWTSEQHPHILNRHLLDLVPLPQFSSETNLRSEASAGA